MIYFDHVLLFQILPASLHTKLHVPYLSKKEQNKKKWKSKQPIRQKKKKRQNKMKKKKKPQNK